MTRPLPTPEVLERVRLGLRPTSRWGILGASRKQLDRTVADMAAEIAAAARARVDADPRYQTAKTAHERAVADYNRARPDIAEAAQRVTATQQALNQAEAAAYAAVYGQPVDPPTQPASVPRPPPVHRENLPGDNGHDGNHVVGNAVERGLPAPRS